MADSTEKNTNWSVAPDGCAYRIPDRAGIRASFETLAREADAQRRENREIVVVQGLGFVGMAVAAVLAGARTPAGTPRFFVIGVDLALPSSYWKVGKISEGKVPFASPDATLDHLVAQGVVATGNLRATVSDEVYSLADVIVVDIPLDAQERWVDRPEEIQVDMRSFEEAMKTVGHQMRPDALVLIETTVPVGTTEKIAAPILRNERAQRGIRDPLLLAHAYERVMPGARYVASIREFWRSYAGVDALSAQRAREFLSSFIDTSAHPLCELPDTVSSEIAKLLENSYRAANIALIHEWALLAEGAGVNLFTVVDSIRVRRGTHDNMRYPGFGVGGYCLTKDSYLAQWGGQNLLGSGVTLDMTLHALGVNIRMPIHTLDLLREVAAGELRGKTILIAGVSYLAEVADTRRSPTYILYHELQKIGASVVVHDPCVRQWIERPQAELTQDLASALRRADGVVLAVPHRSYLQMPAEEFIRHAERTPFVVDAQNILSDEKAATLHHSGWRLAGVGKGHWRKKGYHRFP